MFICIQCILFDPAILPLEIHPTEKRPFGRKGIYTKKTSAALYNPEYSEATKIPPKEEWKSRPEVQCPSSRYTHYPGSLPVSWLLLNILPLPWALMPSSPTLSASIPESNKYTELWTTRQPYDRTMQLLKRIRYIYVENEKTSLLHGWIEKANCKICILLFFKSCEYVKTHICIHNTNAWICRQRQKSKGYPPKY